MAAIESRRLGAPGPRRDGIWSRGAAFVCGCDAPFVTIAYIERLAELLADHDAVVPVVGGYRQPLSAMYRVSVGAKARELLAAGRRSMMGLLDAIDVRAVDAAELDSVDPGWDALRNTNTPAEYPQGLGEWRWRNKST